MDKRFIENFAFVIFLKGRLNNLKGTAKAGERTQAFWL